MTQQYGTAQKAFIDKVRGKITRDPRGYFKQQNWRNIEPSGGKYDSDVLNAKSKKTTTVEAFYVRPLACWVPHLLIENHVPKCPHCKKSDQVDLTKTRWINSPKILFGIGTHKYIDTMLYPCQRCRRHFAGYNKQSMQLSASVYYGYFNYYLGHGYAVDEPLYRHVVDASGTEATSTIASRLKRAAFDEYYADHQLYLSAVACKKITNSNKRKRMEV